MLTDLPCTNRCGVHATLPWPAHPVPVFNCAWSLRRCFTLRDLMMWCSARLLILTRSRHSMIFRRVLVKTLKECTFTIDCDATSTVLEMKHKVAEQDAQWHVQRQRCQAPASPHQTSAFPRLKSHDEAATHVRMISICASVLEGSDISNMACVFQ